MFWLFFLTAFCMIVVWFCVKGLLLLLTRKGTDVYPNVVDV